MDITVTQQEKNRQPSWALGQQLGQKARGSGDPINEFSLIWSPNMLDGAFTGTYTLTIPDGRITTGEIRAILDNPQQPPPSADDLRLAELDQKLRDGSANMGDIMEIVRHIRGV